MARAAWTAAFKPVGGFLIAEGIGMPLICARRVRALSRGSLHQDIQPLLHRPPWPYI
jgi:hypothetical protein